MKIEIVLPDTALVGVLNYVNIDIENGNAGLCYVDLNKLQDGNIYTVTDEVKSNAEN